MCIICCKIIGGNVYIVVWVRCKLILFGLCVVGCRIRGVVDIGASYCRFFVDCVYFVFIWFNIFGRFVELIFSRSFFY